MMRERDDLNELIEQAMHGDKTAFVQLIQAASDQLHAFFRRHVANHDDVEDLLQDYWLTVWKGRKTYAKRKGAWRWLATIALNVLRDHQRRIRPPLPTIIDRVTPHQPDKPDFDFDKVATKCLGHLPPKQRLVFYLCGVKGLSPKDAAHVARMNRSTLRNHLNQARKSLRQYLRQWFPEYAKKR